MAACALALAAEPVQGQEPEDANPLVLAVKLDTDTVSETMPGLQKGDEVYLPIGELSRTLTISIRSDPEKGTASGWVLDESREFMLDTKRGVVSLDGVEKAVAARDIIVEQDDIYVAERVLSQWLPLDLDTDMPTMTVMVKPRERLPLQDRLERQKKGKPRVPVRGAYERPGFPAYEEPYRLVRAPTIDQTLGVNTRRIGEERTTNVAYSAYATGDLLGLETSLFYGRTNQDGNNDELRVTMGRNDPDAGLLGPLHARSALVGSVSLPSISNVKLSSPSGNGFLLSNRPLTQPTSFDTHTLEGPLPPGWDVELYFNDALVGFQQSGPSGKYTFLDQPLIYGPNEFRLVFHGPLGQVRVERQSFLRDRASVAPGEFVYTFGSNKDTRGRANAMAQFDLGIADSLTVNGGLSSIPVNDEDRRFANLGVRAYWRSAIFGLDTYRDDKGGTLNELSVRTRIGGTSVTASTAAVKDFASDYFLQGPNKTVRRDRLRADGYIPLGDTRRLPLALEVKNDTHEQPMRDVEAMGRLSAYLGGTSLSNTLSWRTLGDLDFASGTAQMSRRIAGLGVTGVAQYEVRPEKRLSALALMADKSLPDGYMWNAGVSKALGQPTHYLAGVAKRLGSFGMSANLDYAANGDVAVGFQFFFAAARDPRSGSWVTDAQPMAPMGAASVRMFLDSNLNGIADAGEQPIRNVGFTVNGGNHRVRTNEEGMAFIDRLPVRQHVDLGINTAMLEDPQWSPRVTGLDMVPRPGVVSKIDVPVILTGEIDGTTYLWEEGQTRQIGDLQLELVDRATGKVAKTATSASDGFYVLEAVPPGDYLLRIAREQLKRLKLTDTGQRVLTVGRNGEIISGIDFYIIREFDPSRPAPPANAAAARPRAK